jgi:hypothetical protein
MLCSSFYNVFEILCFLSLTSFSFFLLLLLLLLVVEKLGFQFSAFGFLPKASDTSSLHSGSSRFRFKKALPA